MATPAIKDEILTRMDRLPEALQRRVLEFAEALAKSELGRVPARRCAVSARGRVFEMSFDPRALRLPQGPRSGINALIGSVPDEESDGAVRVLLLEIS